MSLKRRVAALERIAPATPSEGVSLEDFGRLPVDEQVRMLRSGPPRPLPPWDSARRIDGLTLAEFDRLPPADKVRRLRKAAGCLRKWCEPQSPRGPSGKSRH